MPPGHFGPAPQSAQGHIKKENQNLPTTASLLMTYRIHPMATAWHPDLFFWANAGSPVFDADILFVNTLEAETLTFCYHPIGGRTFTIKAIVLLTNEMQPPGFRKWF
jgi:hypothetical protein